VRATLVVGANGRNSVVRDYSGLPIENLGAPTDVLWMRLSRHADGPEVFFYADRGRALFLTGRGRCSAPKAAIAEMQAKASKNFVRRLSSWSLPPGPSRGAPRLDRLETIDRQGESPAAVASPRPGVHRRYGSRHVSRWGRGDQSCHSGRGPGGQYAGGTPSRGRCQPPRSCEDPAPPCVPHAAYAAGAGIDPKTTSVPAPQPRDCGWHSGRSM